MESERSDVPAPFDSVIPHPVPRPGRTLGRRASSVRSSSGAHVELPPPIVRNDDRSYFSRSGHSSSRHSCVGTSDHIVAPCFSVSSRCRSSRHLPVGGYTIVIPAAVAITSWQLSPDTWKYGDAEIVHGVPAGSAGSRPACHRARDAFGAAQHRHVDEVNVAAVREQRALRTARRAAREQDEERIVFVDRNVGKRRARTLALRSPRTRPRTRRPVRAAPVHRRAARCAAGRRAAPSASVRSSAYVISRPGPPAVHRNGDRTEQRRRPERDRILDAVRGRDRDPIALADAVTARAACARPRPRPRASPRT